MNTPKNKPDISEIEYLLGEMQPQPSEEFYHRMEMSPWVRIKREQNRRKSLIDRILLPKFQVKALFIAILLFLVLALGIINTSNFIVIAQQIAKYILPAESDQLYLPFANSVTISPTASETLDDFPLNQEEVQDLAVIKLKRIPLSKNNLIFNGARYDPSLEAVTMRYELDKALILFTQRSLNSIDEYTSVGASAPIESIRVRGVVGEYVEGGWKILPEYSESSPTVSPYNNSNLTVIWDPDLPQRILRWQEDNIVFEILVTGIHSLEKSDIVKIAESIR